MCVLCVLCVYVCACVRACVCEYIHHSSALKKQVPKFNQLAEDLVQTLRGVADGKTSFDLRDHYRNTTLHAVSLVWLLLPLLIFKRYKLF